MKKICVMYLVLLSLTSTTLMAEEINFFEGTWEEALQKAKTENKLIFMDAYATWCRPCKMMEQYTFTNETVAEYYNANFVNVRYDMEAYPGTMLSEKYTVPAYPTLLYINSQGEMVHRGCGALDPDEFMYLGQQAQNPAKQLGSLQKRYEAGERDAAFLAEYTQLLEDACLDGNAVMTSYFESIPNEDLMKPQYWAVMQDNIDDVYSPQFQYVLANRAKFAEAHGVDEVNDFVDGVLGNQYLSITEGDGAQAFALASLMQMMKDHGSNKSMAYYIGQNLAEAKKDWTGYAKATVELVRETQLDDPGELNEYAWKFYLYVDDEKQLQQALAWAKLSVSTEANASNTDTLAALYYKLGNKAEALQLSKNALALAQEEGEDTEHYEKQLKMFEAGQ